MIPFDEDDNKRKRNPFDNFNFDDDFFKDIFNDDHFRDDIHRMTEEIMRMFSSNSPPGKPFVHGFKVEFGPDGRPKIQDFGNKPIRTPQGQPTISEEREPLTDIIEGKDDVAITVELPGVEKEDIDLNVTEESIKIVVNSKKRKYQKTLTLPCVVKPKTTKATYTNGILDVVIHRKEQKSEDTGFKVNIQ